jgi:ABC-type Fe3+-hydroxamate transport system substrate-binding protein
MTRTFKDQIGNSIDLPSPPGRIISLVPSQTELLFDLGLDEQVVGITRYCVLPTQWTKTKHLVGGTKKVNAASIEALRPDLIIANKEENTLEDIESLQKKFPVWVSDVRSLDDALAMIEIISQICERKNVGKSLCWQIRASFDSLQASVCAKYTVVYLIWRKPWIAVGSDTFIHDMLRIIGLDNCLQSVPRYPTVTADQLNSLRPDLIFLSSEPYPFKEQHRSEIQSISPRSRILLVDGQMFSWYGGRLLKSAEYFKSLRL